MQRQVHITPVSSWARIRVFLIRGDVEEVTSYPGSRTPIAFSITESHRDSQDIQGADVR